MDAKRKRSAAKPDSCAKSNISTKRNLDALTHGSILRGIIVFALPLLGTSVVQQLYGTVDLLFVGNMLGTQASAALGISSLLISCLVGFFIGISVGVNVVLARMFGARDYKSLRRGIHTATALGAIGGILLAICGFTLAPFYISLMQTPAEIVDDAVMYLRIYCLSMVSIALYNMFAGIMRALGDSASPLRAQIVGGVANVGFNALFLMVFHWGIAGTALATLACQTLAAALLARSLTRLHAPYRLQWRHVRLNRDIVISMLAIGVPTGLQSLVITLSNVVIQWQINLLGISAIAAFAAYFKVELPLYYAIVAIGQAATTFVAINVGARQDARARRGTNLCIALGLGTTAVLAWLLLVFGYWAFWIFNQDASVIACGQQVIAITFPLYGIYVFLEVYSASIRARGNATTPMVIILLNICVLRSIILLVLMANDPTLTKVALVFPLSWTTTALCLFVCYRIILKKKNASPQKSTM